jgi:hypothetical protein
MDGIDGWTEGEGGESAHLQVAERVDGSFVTFRVWNRRSVAPAHATIRAGRRLLPARQAAPPVQGPAAGGLSGEVARRQQQEGRQLALI